MAAYSTLYAPAWESPKVPGWAFPLFPLPFAGEGWGEGALNPMQVCHPQSVATLERPEALGCNRAKNPWTRQHACAIFLVVTKTTAKFAPRSFRRWPLQAEDCRLR